MFGAKFISNFSAPSEMRSLYLALLVVLAYFCTQLCIFCNNHSASFPKLMAQQTKRTTALMLSAPAVVVLVVVVA